jgi:hypothetical protein
LITSFKLISGGIIFIYIYTYFNPDAALSILMDVGGVELPLYSPPPPPLQRGNFPTWRRRGGGIFIIKEV